MRKFKKFAAMVSAVALAACAVAPLASFAKITTEKVNDGSITISTAENDHNYSAYQIFDGDLSKKTDSETGKVTITFSNVEWGSGLTKNADGHPEITKNGNKVTIYEALENLDITTGEVMNATNLFSKKNAANESVVLESAEEVSEALKTLTEGTANSFTAIDKVARVFADYINSSNNVEMGNWSKNLDEIVNGDQSGYKATISDPGYYLVIDQAKDSTSGLANGEAISKYILQVAGDTTVAPKADAPQVMKKVYEDEDTTQAKVGFADSEDYPLEAGYNDAADYSIGETIPFKLYGSLPSTFDNYDGYYYQFNDNMGSGLDLVIKGDEASTQDFTVTIKDEETTKVLKNGSNAGETAEFTFAKLEAPSKGFTITINDLKLIDMDDTQDGVQAMSKDAVITVAYNAKLNANAVIGNIGNPNDVSLKYSNNSNTAQGGENDEKSETPKDYNVVFTYELDVTKYLDALEEGKEAGTNDASFKLYKGTGANKQYAVLQKNSENTWKFVKWITESETEKGTLVATKDKGKFEFSGLQDGTYYLEEAVTPTGYNTMEDLEIVIEAYGSTAGAETKADIVTQAYNTPNTEENYTTNSPLKNLTIKYGDMTNEKVAKSGSKNGIVEADIINHAGSALPGTGGIGTTMFYIGGGAMVAVAGVFLITKKRMNKKEN